MKRLIMLVLAVVLLAGGLMVSGQEQTPIGECTQDQYNGMADLMSALADELRAGNLDQMQLLEVQIGLATMRAFCDGYTFTSEEYGEDAITDPIVFRDGTYRVVFEAEGIGSIDFEEVGGDCDHTLMAAFDAGERDEELATFEDCIAILDISVGDPWVMWLEPIIINE